jgi:quinol monooxygenase YgiN
MVLGFRSCNFSKDSGFDGMGRKASKRTSMILTIEMRARTEKTQELYQALQALLPLIRREKGCQGCRAHRDVEDGGIFFLTINWDARTSLEHFMPSENGRALLGAIDMLSGTARARIGHRKPWDVIDTLKRMRRKT